MDDRRRKRAVLAGDEAAWRAWYDETFPRLDAYVLWRCGGLRDVADDVLQDAWLTAVRKLSAFDPDAGPFAAWLRGIAAGLLANRFRLNGRRAKVSLTPQPDAEPADAEALRRERAAAVAAALASLPDRYEEALRLRYLEGLSVADIAARTGETLKAVESLLSRAREAFRSAFPAEEAP
jgi:RNA polymerase sigma-70 factor (ECF subfamily)